MVALNNLDSINSIHKIDLKKWKSTKPATISNVTRQINTHDTTCTSKPICLGNHILQSKLPYTSIELVTKF